MSRWQSGLWARDLLLDLIFREDVIRKNLVLFITYYFGFGRETGVASGVKDSTTSLSATTWVHEKIIRKFELIVMVIQQNLY